jgi:uncharacterized protein DUF7014/AbiJ-like protein
MGIADIFSKRRKRQSGDRLDVFEYDKIPQALRIQIVRIIGDIIGNNVSDNSPDQWYRLIHDTLAREYGVHQLSPRNHLAGSALFAFVENTDVPARVLDAVEISFLVAERAQNAYYNASAKVKMTIAEATAELNQRFLEAGIGYQLENGQILRVDSKFVHAETVKPALMLLSDPRYQGAQDEFLEAHKRYREGDYKGCVVECLKAFESTMKTICEIRNWPYNQKDTAKTLISICLRNGLLPSMLQAQLNAVQAVLESGVPTLRNKTSGHGQGPVPTTVSSHMAAYALHLTAANIVMLVNSEKSLP